MESNQLPQSKGSLSCWLKHIEVEEEDDDEELKGEATLPAIPQPETPNEPMHFLSRSWSLSANEISKALATKQMPPAINNNLTSIHQPFTPHSLSNKVMKPVNRRIRAADAIGRLFHKESTDITTSRKKDKARVGKSTYTLLSVAGLAAALAAATSTGKSKSRNSKISKALASATQLLASCCIELAETAGADKEAVASVVKSAVGIRTASNLLTLTASTATALRGEAVMNARLPREAKRSASISPYKKAIARSPSIAAFHSEKIENEDLPCLRDLLQLTQKERNSNSPTARCLGKKVKIWSCSRSAGVQVHEQSSQTELCAQHSESSATQKPI